MSERAKDGGRRRDKAETLPVANPDHLRALAGPADVNLAAIESVIDDVHLEAPGGGVRIVGGAEARARAKAVIADLLKDVEAGRTPEAVDVRAVAERVLTGGASAATDVVRIGTKSFRARTPNQQAYLAALADPKTTLTFGVGPAGTGKTFLAVLFGAALLKSHHVQRLVIARPAVEAGEKLGFLPGDMNEKVDPYMMPIWDALREAFGKADMDKKREQGFIEVAPLAYMRGRTLKDAFVIVDEAQNATVSQMYMVLTRIGEGARMAVTGDPSQVDLPSGRRSGLAHALRILSGLEGVRAIAFDQADVQRHPLVGRIVAAYERDRDAEKIVAENAQ